MAEFGKPRIYQWKLVETYERVNIPGKFDNENVPIDQFVVLPTETGVTLSLQTNKGLIDIQMTREFAGEIATWIRERLSEDTGVM